MLFLLLPSPASAHPWLCLLLMLDAAGPSPLWPILLLQLRQLLPLGPAFTCTLQHPQGIKRLRLLRPHPRLLILVKLQGVYRGPILGR